MKPQMNDDYPNTELFDDVCLDELCTIFNNNGQWLRLAQAFDCKSQLDEWRRSADPARQLLQFIARQQFELHHVVNLFLELDVRDALSCLDEMIARRMENLI